MRRKPVHAVPMSKSVDSRSEAGDILIKLRLPGFVGSPIFRHDPRSIEHGRDLAVS